MERKDIVLVFINEEILRYHILGNKASISCDSHTSRHSFFCTLRDLVGLAIILLQNINFIMILCIHICEWWQIPEEAEADKETKI